MAIGDAGRESFRRLIPEFRNQHIVAACGPMMTFREEVITNDDFQDRGGTDNSTQAHFLKHLLNCDRIRRRVTYNPDDDDLGKAIAKAIDPNAVIENGVKPAGGDEIQGQSGGLIQFPWDVSGADPNIPLPSQLNLASNMGILLLGAIDQAVTSWTRLESRHRTKFITATDSLRMYGIYQQIYTWLDQFGGDENRVDIANVRPIDEPLGPDSSPNRRSETTGLNQGNNNQ